MKKRRIIKWKQAIQSKLHILEETKTWSIVEKPKNCKEKGSIRHKARLVVRRLTPRKAIDYEETFSPVVRYTFIRFLMALAEKYSLQIEQMDAVTTFLQRELSGNVYIEAPVSNISDDQNLELNKALYGLKQKSMVWSHELNDALEKFELSKSRLDPSHLYVVDMSIYVYAYIYLF